MDLLNTGRTKIHVAILLILAAAMATTSASTWAETSPTATELELALARQPSPYLVIDLASSQLSVRLRGRILEQVPVATLFALRGGHVGTPPPPLDVPVVWHVAIRPLSGRRLQAPVTLLETPAPSPQPQQSSSAPPPPDTYGFQTREGWWVELGRPLATASFLKRTQERVVDGFASWRGRAKTMPDRLALGLDAESARRFHHLFRRDTAILVLGSNPSPGTR